MKHTPAEEYLREFTAEYPAKLYYFCLKKTGIPEEAEELAADICLHVLSGLQKATPRYFPAWVWRIARNRYARWVKERQAIRHAGGAAQQGDVPSDEAGPEEQLVRAQELQALRRELAFIAADYRGILLAYYVQGKKVHEIAGALSLPEGTVKTKLFRARNLLKEGMYMAREFGKRSYNPEEVRFYASGNQPSGLPWRVVNRKIPQNILLAAHNNPCTLEELAIELGIALPYMEEEVKILLEATLLICEQGKYLTNFFIFGAEVQKAIFSAQKKEAEEIGRLAGEILKECLPEIKQLGIMKNDMKDADFCWLLFTVFIDQAINQDARGNTSACFQRPDGGNWGFMGLEKIDPPLENNGSGHDGAGNSEIAMFWRYAYPDYNMWQRAGYMGYHQTLFLGEVVKNSRPLASFTLAEKDLWKEINNRFAHANSKGFVVPDIAVFTPEKRNRLNAILSGHPAFLLMAQTVSRLFDEVVGMLKRESGKVIKEQPNYYAAMMMLDLRMMAIRAGVASGVLTVPENPETSTVSMWLDLA